MKDILRAAVIAALLSTHAHAQTVDATPAFDAAVSTACSSPDNRLVKYPAGAFTFVTRPQPMPCALTVQGAGIGATTFERRFNGGAFLHWARGTDHSGGSLRDLTVSAGNGTTGGIAIYVQATPDSDGTVNSFNRHSFLIDNVQVGRSAVTSATYWDFGLYLDGSLNPDGNTNSVPGIRGVYVDKSTFGGARVASVYLNKARGTELRLECYTPINGGFAGVMMDNATDSVLLQTRNCGWSIQDATSKGMMLNGVRTGPQ